jgi:energy-coupling factor transporter transmembrane protein EcfT
VRVLLGFDVHMGMLSNAAIRGQANGKTLQVSGEVHMAMQARGFRGEIRLLDELQMRPHDWLRLAAFVGAATLAVWLGR